MYIYILYTYHTNMAGGYTHVLCSSLFELMNWKITCFDGYINDKPPIFQFDMFVYQRVSHFLKPVAGFTFSLGKLWWSWLGRPWHIHRVSDVIWCHENENLMWNALDHELAWGPWWMCLKYVGCDPFVAIRHGWEIYPLLIKGGWLGAMDRWTIPAIR